METETPRDPAVNPISSDDERRGEAASVAGDERDALARGGRLHDVRAGHQLGALPKRERQEQIVELDAADHQRGRLIRFDHGRRAARPFEVQALQRMGGDPRQRILQVRKPLQHAQADAAAARFVSRKGRAIEDPDRNAGSCQRSRRRRAGRAGANHEDRVRGGGNHIGIVAKIQRKSMVASAGRAMG